MNKGWIKISRSIRQHWIYANSKWLKWWIDILLRAEYNSQSTFYNKTKVFCKAGQFVSSFSRLAKDWGTSRKTVKAFFLLLSDEKMVTYKTTKRYVIFNICNYGLYQRDETEDKSESQQNYQQNFHQDIQTNSQQINNFSNCNSSNYDNEFNKLGQQNYQHSSQQVSQPTSQTSIKNKNKRIEEIEEDMENSSSSSSTQILKEKERAFKAALDEFEAEEQEMNSPEGETPPGGKKIPKSGSSAGGIEEEGGPAAEIFKMWNQECLLAGIRMITGGRAENFQKACRDMEAKTGGRATEVFRILIDRIKSSPFLRGENPKGWRASFDWLISKPDNWVRVFEGAYEPYSGKQTSGKKIDNKNVNEIWNDVSVKY